MGREPPSSHLTGLTLPMQVKLSDLLLLRCWYSFSSPVHSAAGCRQPLMPPLTSYPQGRHTARAPDPVGAAAADCLDSVVAAHV